MKRIEIRKIGENAEDINEKPIMTQSTEDETKSNPAEIQTDLSKVDGEEQLVDESEQWKDKYLRLYAELENTKKRLAKRFEIELQEETGAVLLDLLPVADNLERVLAYASERGDRELERGLEMTLVAFKEAMAKHGVSQIKAHGEPFNPEFHEAIGEVPTPKFDEGTILKVDQTGYMLNGKVLRPAKVLIASR